MKAQAQQRLNVKNFQVIEKNYSTTLHNRKEINVHNLPMTNGNCRYEYFIILVEINFL